MDKVSKFMIPDQMSFSILFNSLPERIRNSAELIILDFGEHGTIRIDELRERADETINKLYSHPNEPTDYYHENY